MQKNTPWAIKTLVPDEVYTDRQEYMDYFYKYALKSATRRSRSMVLLGMRRMGKTEIFKRVVNRLFFEQDLKDPAAVVPVYYSLEFVRLAITAGKNKPETLEKHFFFVTPRI